MGTKKNKTVFNSDLKRTIEAISKEINGGCTVADKRKLYIVNPVIRTLGYDMFNSDEVGYNESIPGSKRCHCAIYIEGQCKIAVLYEKDIKTAPSYWSFMPDVVIKTDGVSYGIYLAIHSDRVVAKIYTGGPLGDRKQFSNILYEISFGVYDYRKMLSKYAQDFMYDIGADWLLSQKEEISQMMAMAFFHERFPAKAASVKSGTREYDNAVDFAAKALGRVLRDASIKISEENKKRITPPLKLELDTVSKPESQDKAPFEGIRLEHTGT